MRARRRARRSVRRRPVTHAHAAHRVTRRPGRRAPTRTGEKLATLLEVSKGLGRAVDTDAILDKIVRVRLRRCSTWTAWRSCCSTSDSELVPKISRDKRGADAPRMVPQSIARTAVDDKVAMLSDNAGEDTRFGGQSVLLQQVRSAICAPLIGSEDRVLGVLYVDNVSTTHRFSDDDLDFVVAFSGIAAVAIENSQFAERIRRETLARSNFERYFAPQLAQRIAVVGRRDAPGRRQAEGGGAVQRHPRLHGAVGDDEPGRHGAACSASTSPRWWTACSATTARWTSSSATR